MRRYSYTLFLSVSLLVSVLFAKETTIFGKNDQTSAVSNGTERVEETEKPVEEEMREVDAEKGESGLKDSEETAETMGNGLQNPDEPVVGEDVPLFPENFQGVLFIGDSRTEGLILYTGLSNATVYANQGLMVDTVFTSPVIQMDGQRLSVVEALKRTEFKKVYIALGINETGWAYESIFIDKYQKLIQEIQAINPQAILYIQEIMPVTAQTSQTHSYVKNDKIQRYNELLAKLAEEMGVYYIDTGAAGADDSGCLPEDAAIDGIHLKKPYCDKWLDYLKTHTVQPEEGA